MEASCSSTSSSLSSVGGSIKLAINKNDQLRRIAIIRLLKDRNDVESISFEILKQYAISFAGLKSKDDGALNTFIVKATYLDEDGDCIEISTDEELADAVMFQDEINRGSNNRASSLLTIQVEVKESEEKATMETHKEITSESTSEVTGKSDSSSQTEKEIPTPHVDENETLDADENKNQVNEYQNYQDYQEPIKPPCARRPQRQRRYCRNQRYKHQKHVPPPVKVAVDTVLNFVNDTVDTITAGLSPYPASTHYTQTVFDANFVHSRHTCDGCGASPILGYRYHATNIPDFDLCLPCKSKCVLPDISFIQAQDGAITVPSPQYEGFDPNFVHSRHTCDGCGLSPIVGYRWHSTNLVNYDLCDGCKSKTTCTDITFQLQQIEADRAYPRSNPISPVNKPRTGDEDSLSSDLQKALQLSFEELKAKEKSADDAKDEAKTPANNEPFVLSASEALEFLIPPMKLEDEKFIKSTPQIRESDSMSETGTQTDIALLPSTEDKSQQTEENIVTEDEKDDIEDSFTSIEKDDSKFTSDDVDVETEVSSKEEEKEANGDDEWAMVDDETDFVALGSSLFRQGLSSSQSN